MQPAVQAFPRCLAVRQRPDFVHPRHAIGKVADGAAELLADRLRSVCSRTERGKKQRSGDRLVIEPKREQHAGDAQRVGKRGLAAHTRPAFERGGGTIRRARDDIQLCSSKSTLRCIEPCVYRRIAVLNQSEMRNVGHSFRQAFARTTSAVYFNALKDRRS